MKVKKQTAMPVSLLLAVLLAVASPVWGQEQPQQQPQQGLGELTPPQPSQEEWMAMQAVYQATDPQQRLALVEDFLAKYPQSMLLGRIYAAAAEVYRVQNNYPKVIEYGEKAIELSQQKDALSLLIVADALAESAGPIQPDYQEKLAKAEDYARKALEVLPALFASVERRPEVPEETYAAEQKQAEALGRAILGFIHLRRAEYPRAEEELKKATDLQAEIGRPQAVDLQRLGYAHLRQQELKEAEAVFQRCAELTTDPQAQQDCQKRLESVRERLTAQEPKPQE